MNNKVHFDPTDSSFLQNPYPAYADLRATSPIFYDEDNRLWLFTRHEDVDNILRDRRFGRSILHLMSREELDLPPENPEYEPFLKLGKNSMFDKEPPEHTRLRSLVHKVFTPQRIRDLHGTIQSTANAILNPFQPSQSIDVLSDFAAPLSVTVIATLLGIPSSDQYKLRPWSNDIVKMYELDHTEDQAQAAIRASQEFADYLKYLANIRRKEPHNDLITALALVEEEGDKLTEDEMVSTCVLLLNAGHEATVNVLGNGLLALLKNPDQFNRFKANLEMVRTVVEELMRYDTPLQLFRRWVLVDHTYKDINLKKGTEVGLMFGAANRDPDIFTNPDELNITRDPNPHISFGGGVHYCLGAPLARMELHIAFTSLLSRFPDLDLYAEPQYHPTYVIRGLSSLKVIL